jgi:small-conductance mechanosensitive channel
MSKKMIIITAAAGLLGFGGSFVSGWLSVPPRPAKSDEPPEETAATAGSFEPSLPAVGPASPVQMTKTMDSRRIKDLVYEVRENIREYEDKLRSLEGREERLNIAQQQLKEDIEKLNSLRVELASMVAALKSEQEKLAKTRLEIGQAEKENLAALSAAYDKMEPSSASKILTSMCAKGELGAQRRVYGGQASNMDDAVKILHYMGERTKAELLSELAGTEPKLAAVLCQRLKQIVEQK